MLCHHYPCVFVHIPRTAGQSIEHFFLNLLGLSWRTRAPLLLRPNDVPELGPPRLAHLKAYEYVSCKYMTSEQFQTYFKFSFVRNPWDRMVSIYRFHGYADRCEFKRFLMGDFLQQVWANEYYWQMGPQVNHLCDENGKRLVDFVGRFENLQPDFEHVCRKLKIPPGLLPHVNQSRKGRFDHAHYAEYYDDETREFVAEHYRRDIERFAYRFGLDPDIDSGTSASAPSGNT